MIGFDGCCGVKFLFVCFTRKHRKRVTHFFCHRSPGILICPRDVAPPRLLTQSTLLFVTESNLSLTSNINFTSSSKNDADTTRRKEENKAIDIPTRTTTTAMKVSVLTRLFVRTTGVIAPFASLSTQFTTTPNKSHNMSTTTKQQ